MHGDGRVGHVVSVRIAVRCTATLIMALCLTGGTAVAATTRVPRTVVRWRSMTLAHYATPHVPPASLVTLLAGPREVLIAGTRYASGRQSQTPCTLAGGRLGVPAQRAGHAVALTQHRAALRLRRYP
jgi:hypothetical protein